MRYEKRRCDYCNMLSDSTTPAQLKARGWTEVEPAVPSTLPPLDRCPTCSFTEDTTPLRNALETFADAAATPSTKGEAA